MVKGEIKLEPGEVKSLYLEFQPTEPIIYSLFVPYILNGLIGPPRLNSPKSLSSSTYYQYSLQSSNFPKKIITETLPVLRARCISGTPWIKFSSLNIEFQSSEEENTFTITNSFNCDANITLQINHLSEEFIMIPEENQDIVKAEKVLKLCLEPQQKFSFLIKFQPKEFGKYYGVVPIRIDLLTRREPFNCLSLRGWYPQPTIKSSLKILCFQTVPLNVQLKRTVSLLFSHHKAHCSFQIKSTCECFKTSHRNKIVMSPNQFTCDLVIVFSPKREDNYLSELTVSCSCNSHEFVQIRGCASYANILLYKSPLTEIPVSVSGKPFPYYLQGYDKLTVPVDTVIKHLENWLYTQGFFGQYQYMIPYTICRYPFNLYENKKKNCFGKKKKNTIHLPIVQLLMNVIDKSVIKYLIIG